MKWALRFLPLLLVVMLFGSCDRNLTSNPGSGGSTTGTPTTISIAPISPIRNFAGSSVSQTITATVTDSRNAAVAGQQVVFQLTELKNGLSLTYVAGDTTDVNGHVSATLQGTLDSTETMSVTARLAANSQVYTTAPCQVILLSDQIQTFSLNFAGAKSTIVYRQGGRDSTQLVAQILDNAGGGISGLTVNFQVVHTDTASATNYVALSATSGTTDANGECRIWLWNNSNSNVNRQVTDSIAASIQGMLLGTPHRTAGIVVRIQPLTAPSDIFLRWVNPSDTVISSQEGVVVTRSFVVWCQDSSHVRLPNIPIILRSEGIGSVPYVTTISSFGLDTIAWSSDGMIGRVTITAAIVQSQTFDKTGHGPLKLGPTAKLDNGMPQNMQVDHRMSSLSNTQLLGINEVNSLSASISLVVSVPASVTALTTRIRQNPPIIYSTGLDSLEVDVTLRDQNNSGVANAVLTFSTAHGVIPATETTDITGSVVVYLRDGGDTTGASGTYLFVRYPTMNLVDSVWFAMLPKLNLGRITLNGPTENVAMPSDTVGFTANLFLEGGNYAYDSSRVYWYSYKRYTTQNSFGAFSFPITRIVNGATNNTFTMRTGVGYDSLVAMSFTPGHTDTVRTYTIFEHVPGPAVHLQLYPQTAFLTVNGVADTVKAVVKDTSGNIVPRSQMSWECTNGAGSIVPNGYSFTGDTAFALLSASSLSGTFRYWATSVNNATDTASFIVNASTPRTLTLSSDSQILQVRGTGGNENTSLRAVVRDGNGNPVSGGTTVFFQITNVSQFLDTSGVGTEPYFNQPGLDTTTSTTSGTGEALAILSAGYKSGAVQITAWVLQDGVPSNISATLSNVQIVAGPPAQISVSYNANNGNQEGGGTWSIWVNATVRDRYSNPVANRYSVAFSVSPISLAQVGLDTAATGNTGPTSQHLPGVAFTRLSYQGQNSFDTVTVHASAVSRDNNNNLITISDSTRFALPLQQGALQLNVTPNTFLFSRFPTSATDINVATHMVWVDVTDGYGLPIHGAPVLFAVQRGKLYRTATEALNRTYNATYRVNDNSQNFLPNLPNVYWPVNKRKSGNYTSTVNSFWNYTDPNGAGCATLYIGALGPCYNYNSGNPVGEVFLDPQTAETTSEVTATIEGYPGVQQVRVVINYQRS